MFEVSAILFFGLYAISLYMNKRLFLLSIAPLVLEIATIIKIIVYLRGEDSGQDVPKVRKRHFYHCFARLISYSFLFGWTIHFDFNYKPGMSIMPGFFPIMLFSIYSIFTHFFWAKFEKIWAVVVFLYKICRALFFGQCLFFGSILQTEDNKSFDVINLQSELWPIQIGGLLLSTIILIAIIYYLYFVVSGLLGSGQSFNKRHVAASFWVALFSISLAAVLLISLKFRSTLFDKSDSSIVQLIVCIGILLLNLLISIIMRQSLQ